MLAGYSQPQHGENDACAAVWQIEHQLQENGLGTQFGYPPEPPTTTNLSFFKFFAEDFASHRTCFGPPRGLTPCPTVRPRGAGLHRRRRGNITGGLASRDGIPPNSFYHPMDLGYTIFRQTHLEQLPG